MSDIKFPPLPDELNKDILRSIAWDFAKAAVELNRPQVPEDAELDRIQKVLINGCALKCAYDAADAITALRRKVFLLEGATSNGIGYANGLTAKQWMERAERAEAELAAARKENDALRGIAANVMPCHYCGVDHISKCPHGFPGCALADDMMCAEESAVIELRKVMADLAAARKEIEALRSQLMRERQITTELQHELNRGHS